MLTRPMICQSMRLLLEIEFELKREMQILGRKLLEANNGE